MSPRHPEPTPPTARSRSDVRNALPLRACIALLSSATLAAACTSSAEDGDGTAATEPPATQDAVGDDTGTDEDETTASPADDQDAGDDAVATGDAVEPAGSEEITDAPTTTLVASEAADLPTANPDDLTDQAPPTTAPGPLDVPSVQLIGVGTFDTPVDLAWRDLDPRFFVVQQGGSIVAFDAESSVTVLDFGDLDDFGTAAQGERGLLGLAFHPDADLAYVNFTDEAGTTVVAEFAVDPVTAEFDPASAREVLTIEQPFANHNGGDLEFGPDGFLYIGTGDGGSGGDPERNALDLTSRLGKLLRIDPLPGDDGRPFTVPEDNPYLGADDADPTIWSSGLRNPWKFDFDDLTGDLWIADVGQNEFEEISLAPATDGTDAGRAVSFGWSAFEGDARFNDDEPADGHVPPVATYPHADGNCSISGGVVARDSSYDELNGWYVYGDFCSGTVWALDTTSVGISDGTRVGEPVVVELTQVPSLVAVRTGPDGDLYALSIAGDMFRIVEG